MSIQRLFIVLLALVLTVLIGIFITLGLIIRNSVEIERAEQRKFMSQKIADELRQSSDDLTHMARLYVVTKEIRYRKHYEEIVKIRNGEAPRPDRYDLVYWDLVGEDDVRPRPTGEAISIDERMIQQGFTVQEFKKLQESRNRSDALVLTETVAMNAMEGRFDDGTGSFTRQGEPNPSLAIDLMFNTNYMASKAAIMEPINKFMTMTEDRTAAQVTTLIRRGRVLGGIALVLSIAAVAAAAGTLVALRRRVLIPLRRAVESVEAVAGGNMNHSIDHQAEDEMGTFVKAYNTMLQKMGEALAGLEHSNESLRQQGEALRTEKERSESLLLNILPAGIADRLKDGETSIADVFPEVSVFFADLVGFTQLTERIGPREIVKTLGDIFAIFDAAAERNNVEKIKTIGDSYMAVSGLPEPVADHARHVAEFALQSLRAIEEYAATHELGLHVRMGIHSGTAVAGIVGTKRFAYDMWGDVVNVASRMESTGHASKIHVSESTMVRLQDMYEFELVGEIEVKGKGRMRTWYLNGRRYSEAPQSETNPVKG